MPLNGQAAGLAKKEAEEPLTPAFSAEELKAPFVLRCLAAFVDYLVIVFIPVAWLLLARWVTGELPNGLGGGVFAIILVVLVVNFLLLPLVRGKTLGKMLFGLSIVRRDGRRLGLVQAILRHLVGYPISILTLGLGFFMAGFDRQGRGLHDVVAGTVVIRGSRISV